MVSSELNIAPGAVLTDLRNMYLWSVETTQHNILPPEWFKLYCCGLLERLPTQKMCLPRRKRCTPSFCPLSAEGICA